jgi:hypothetical protein
VRASKPGAPVPATIRRAHWRAVRVSDEQRGASRRRISRPARAGTAAGRDRASAGRGRASGGEGGEERCVTTSVLPHAKGGGRRVDICLVKERHLDGWGTDLVLS